MSRSNLRVLLEKRKGTMPKKFSVKSGDKSAAGGLTAKGVKRYRAANPGSKLKTAVTTKPSKLKKGSKSAKRRKSFCARMGGMKKRMTSAKTRRDPDSRINKALRKWNCSTDVNPGMKASIAERFLEQFKNIRSTEIYGDKIKETRRRWYRSSGGRFSRYDSTKGWDEASYQARLQRERAPQTDDSDQTDDSARPAKPAKPANPAKPAKPAQTDEPKKDESIAVIAEACWKGWIQKGLKKKGNRMVPNCVKQ